MRLRTGSLPVPSLILPALTLGGLALGTLGSLNLGCQPSGPEEQIQKAFDACVHGVETNDPADVVEQLTPDFSGPEGMGRDDAKLYLMGLLSRQKIGVTVLSNRIEVNGNRAAQNVSLVLTGKSGSGPLPEDTSSRSFALAWQKREGKWRLKEIQETR